MRRAISRLFLFYCALTALAIGAGAATTTKQTAPDASEMIPHRTLPSDIGKDEQPAPWLRWMLHPLKRGMWIRLPIVDTDPNRGVTVGVMPIWVLKEDRGERIKQIHAPSLTYNKNFFVTPTYRYYYYPQEDAALVLRGSMGKYEHELMGHYEDQSFLGSGYDMLIRVQYNVDAGGHFFGLGPDSRKSAETNYKEDALQIRGVWGTPLYDGSSWRVHFGERLLAEKVGNGPLAGFRGFRDSFAGQAPEHRHQSNEMRLILDYDSRNHPVTTTDGAYAQIYNEHSVRDFLSSYDFSRSGLDGRYYYRWGTQRQTVTALAVKFEQLLGDAPFWLLPRLGGKYSLRAYGEGRYTDRSVASVNAEQRFTFYEARVGGVSTEFELDPFAGLGVAADNPGRMAARYTRPVVGAAIRAVARPQVVGSVDFGVGQEGLSVFMDINYSF